VTSRGHAATTITPCAAYRVFKCSAACLVSVPTALCCPARCPVLTAPPVPHRPQPVPFSLFISRVSASHGLKFQSQFSSQPPMCVSLSLSSTTISHLRLDKSTTCPVVFCHGLLGFDSVTIGPAIAPLQVAHWRGIKQALEQNGTRVLITRVPATSSYVDRAKALEERISQEYPGKSVHLIGILLVHFFPPPFLNSSLGHSMVLVPSPCLFFVTYSTA